MLPPWALLVLGAAVVAFLVLRWRRLSKKKSTYANDDEDYSTDSSVMDKIQNECRLGSSFGDALAKFPVEEKDKNKAWKKCLKGDEERKKSGAKVTAAKVAAKCPYGACPSTFMAASKPCWSQDKKTCCNINMENCRDVNIDNNRQFNCKDAKNRQCAPSDGSDPNKYCYKGTAAHNKNMCCERPWSAASGCKPMTSPTASAAPAAAAATDGAALATATLPEDKKVRLMAHSNGTGDSSWFKAIGVVMNLDDAAYYEGRNLHDEASSIWVPDGYKVTLWEHTNGAGRKWGPKTGGQYDLWQDGFNDTVSSMLIEKA